MYGLAAIISGSSIAGGPVPMTADFRPKINVLKGEDDMPDLQPCNITKLKPLIVK